MKKNLSYKKIQKLEAVRLEDREAPAYTYNMAMPCGGAGIMFTTGGAFVAPGALCHLGNSVAGAGNGAVGTPTYAFLLDVEQQVPYVAGDYLATRHSAVQYTGTQGGGGALNPEAKNYNVQTVLELDLEAPPEFMAAAIMAQSCEPTSPFSGGESITSCF